MEPAVRKSDLFCCEDTRIGLQQAYIAPAVLRHSVCGSRQHARRVVRADNGPCWADRGFEQREVQARAAGPRSSTVRPGSGRSCRAASCRWGSRVPLHNEVIEDGEHVVPIHSRFTDYLIYPAATASRAHPRHHTCSSGRASAGPPSSIASFGRRCRSRTLRALRWCRSIRHEEQSLGGATARSRSRDRTPRRARAIAHKLRLDLDTPLLLERTACRDKRAALLRRLDHDRAQRQAADQPVPTREVERPRRGATGKLRHERPLRHDLGSQIRVAGGIHAVDPGTEHGDRRYGRPAGW